MNQRCNHSLGRWSTLLLFVLAVAALWPPQAGLAQSYALKSLYNFNGSDSEFPSGLTLDSNGNLYGNALRGGSPDSSNNGVVYKLSSTGVFTTLAAFDGLDGDRAVGSPLIDAQGNLWGTTYQGGVDWHPELNHFGRGTLYKISLTTGVFTPGILELNGPHGLFPTAQLIMDISGNLIGTTDQGGAPWNPALGSFGSGTVFRFLPNGVVMNPALFDGGNGQNPNPATAVDSQGNLYGTTYMGGPQSYGTLYKISPAGVMTTLVKFNAVNGKNPIGALAIDGNDTVYGTTYLGGVTAINNAVNGYGTIWKWSAAAGLQTLVSFNGTNGMFPHEGVTLDTNGNLYGATVYGGTTGNGVVFKYSLATRVLSTLLDLDGAAKGAAPYSPMSVDKLGNVYGVANLYGPGGYGYVFALQPVSTTLGVTAVTVSPANVQGGATAQGTVTISGPAPAGGMVVTLGSNNSYVTAQGPITIPAGATSAPFTVSTNAVPDNTPVAISASLGATTQQATITVAPPATAAIAMIYINPNVVQGGASAAGSVLLNRVAPTGGATVTLSSDTAGTTVPASITIPAGAMTAPFTIATKAVTATSETMITATLGASTMQAGILVVSPGSTNIGIGNFSVNLATVQGGTPLVGRVSLTGTAPPGGVAVTLSSSNPAVVPASVTVPEGVGIASFPIQTTSVASDTVVTITASVGTSSFPASVTVLAPVPTVMSSFTLRPTTVESGLSSQGTVVLNNVAPAGGAVITLSSGSSAINMPASVAVAEGETSASFAITTQPVAVTTTATITASVGGASQQAILTITSGIPGITVSSFTVNPTASGTPGTTAQGGSPASGTVSLSAAAPWGGALVTLTSSNTAVATVPATVVVPAGNTSASFFIPTKVVSASTTVTLTATLGASTASVPLTVSPVPSLTSVSFNPASVTGGQSATGTVSLSGAAPAGGMIVTLANNNGSATVPTSVTVAAGATSASFSVSTLPVAANSIATITATAGGSSQQGTLAITLPGPTSLSSLTLNPTSVRGGTSSQGTVTLSGPAPSGGVVVTLASGNTGVATVPSSVTVAAGKTSATFTVSTKSQSADTSAKISASSGGVTKTATLTVTRR